MKIVECVPNFSEGRRPEVVQAIVDAIGAVGGVKVLNVNSDADHNRMVVTFAGAPEAVLEGAYAGIAEASERIDLTQHQGVHPRIGAADVVPFVPISGVTMTECVELAQRLGERVGHELQLPVYLYEQAATRPERRRLELVRQGGYEGVQAIIANDPARTPDYGPSVMGKAGAVITGARNLLVAFNVYLTTEDVGIAQAIALKLRASGGGFPHVKAMGVKVKGLAQVSMNFTDFTQTPVHVVMEALEREAATYGVSIERSEVIGLIPQMVLMTAGLHTLHLDGLGLEQVLEPQMRGAFGGAAFE